MRACSRGLRARQGIVAALFTALGGSPAAAEDVTVYAAASLTNAVTAIADAYQAAGLGAVTLVSGSSGALANQIVQGAPADVYLSANADWIAFLAENAAIAADKVHVFASNSLVVILPPGSGLALDARDDADAALGGLLAGQRIVIGDPATAPVGAYARQALTSLGVWPAIEDGLILAQDATAALTYVSRDAVDAGIVYRTDAAQADVIVLATLPAGSHDPISYFAAPVLGGNAVAAEEFLALLLGNQGQAVLDALGFAPPQESTVDSAQ